jgi:hypothetical protein
VQLGTHVPNVRVHVFKASDVRVIIGLQDMWANSVVKAYKACGQAATVRLQCSASTIDHSPDIAAVLSDSTACHHVAD